jgi:hypothetical protein
MAAKPITVPEKLLKVADEIAEGGSANLTRLTVLKKWFDGPLGPSRMRAFGAWMAQRAIVNGLKAADDEVAPLFKEARSALRGCDRFPRKFSPAEQEKLRTVHNHLRDFQDTYRRIQWGAVRQIENWQLFLVESGLALLMRHSYPSEAYRLAASYCENYDSRYFNGLNGPSSDRILDIARFVRRMEAAESDPVS